MSYQMRKLLLFTISVLAFQFSFSQASKNVTLLANVPFQGGLNDCWGYVDGNGDEYALVGLMDGGVAIVSLANPSNPQVLQTIPGVPSTWRDLKTYQDHAYIINDDGGFGGSGLLVLDLSTLPGTVAYKDTMINGFATAHNLYMDGGYLYVVGGDLNGGIEILDVATDPWRPNFVGAYTTNYVHDVYVRNNIAYAGELNNGLTLIDVSNKTLPQIVGNQTYNGNFTHNTWLNDASTVCFTTDEVNEGWVYSWNVADPGNIQYLDGIRSSLSNGLAIPHNTHVLNDYLVTSYYKDGLNIVDAARPHNLIEVGYYDTFNGSGGGFDGLWGAYPFFPSGVVIGSDMTGGLYVFDVSYTRACYLEGLVTDSVTGQPIPGASVVLNTTTANTLSDNAGDYATGTADAGSYTATYSKFGYTPKTINVTLTNGQVTIEDVALAPQQRVNYTINVIEQGTGNPIPNAVVSLEEASAGILSYTANASGVVNDPNFVQGSYTLTAGQWGWRTKQMQISANSSNTSVTIELPVGYYDDFVLDLGWNVSSTASAGIWERGEPNGTTFQGFDFNPDDDVSGDLGDQAYVTGNGGGNAGDDDVDNGETNLKSPVMDLTTYTDPVLKFHAWFANAGGFGGNPDDSLIVQLSNGNGFTNLIKYTGNGNSFWGQQTFDLNTLNLPITNNMQITFICGDYNQGHLTEGAVDLFEVVEKNATAVEEEIENFSSLQVSPNPATGANVSVAYDLGVGQSLQGASLEIRDIYGRLLRNVSLRQSQGQFTVNLNLPSGMYIATLKNDGKALNSFRIVK